MNVKALLAVSSVALAGIASFGCVSGSLLRVSAVDYGRVNTSHDYYFDYLRVHDQDSWTVLNQVYVMDYNYTSLAFNTSFSISNFSHDSSVNSSYMFRFCADEYGDVRLYYLQYPVGALGITYLYDFSLSFLTDGSIVFENLALHMAGSASVSYTLYFPSTETTVDGLYSNVSKVIYTGAPSSTGPLMQFSGRWSATYNNPSDSYMDGYRDGESEGREQGYDSGVADGRSDGYASGYSGGYVDGYSAGDSAGYASGVVDGAAMGETTVVDIWPLLSAVLTMPFTFFSQNWNATLFSGTPFEFNLSLFLSSVLILLFVWKIITMVVGFTK